MDRQTDAACVNSLTLISAAERPDIGQTVAKLDQLNRNGEATLEMLRQMTVSANSRERRAETVVARAAELLKVAEERINTLETRLAEAENEARAANQWIIRLQADIRGRFMSAEATEEFADMDQQKKAA